MDLDVDETYSISMSWSVQLWSESNAAKVRGVPASGDDNTGKTNNMKILPIPPKEKPKSNDGFSLAPGLN